MRRGIFYVKSILATGVSVTDILPEGITLVSASDDGVYDDTTREIFWDLGFFAGQTSMTLTVAFTVDDPFPGGSGQIFFNYRLGLP